MLLGFTNPVTIKFSKFSSNSIYKNHIPRKEWINVCACIFIRNGYKNKLRLKSKASSTFVYVLCVSCFQRESIACQIFCLFKTAVLYGLERPLLACQRCLIYFQSDARKLKIESLRYMWWSENMNWNLMLEVF